MTDDPIVAEVRAVRDAHARQFDYDLDAICRDLQAKQLASGRKLVSFPARRPLVIKPNEDLKSATRANVK